MSSKDIPEFPPPFELPLAKDAPPKLVMFLAYIMWRHMPMGHVENALSVGLTQKGRQAMPEALIEHAERMARALVSED